MNAEFDWWLLLVGIVGGAALVWLVVGDMRRRDDEVADDERTLEAEWIADAFGAAGRSVDATTVTEILDLHRAYLAGPAPELDPVDQVGMAGAATTAADGRSTPAAAHYDDRAATLVPADPAPDGAPSGVVPPDVGAPDVIQPVVRSAGITPPGITSPGITSPGITSPAPGPGGGQPHQARGDGS